MRPNLQYFQQKAELELAALFQTSSRNTKYQKMISDYLDQFQHIPFRWGVAKSWDQQAVETIINEIQNPLEKLTKLETERQKIQQRYNDLMKELRFSDAELQLINTAQQCVWMRTYRSETCSFSLAYILPLLQEIACRLGIRAEDALYLSMAELANFIQGEPEITQQIIDARKHAYAVVILDRVTTILAGDDVIKLKQALQKLPQNKTQVQGMVANKPVAMVSGTVCVVHTPDDLKKVHAGHIIVATMTTPNFITAMEKAAGFVTDEGGILCHAAIISREMNKPCIVGTVHATQIFSDGEQVQLNLQSGVVTKLKKS